MLRLIVAALLIVLSAGLARAGENRPASVVQGGLTTSYTYAADGSRLLRTDPTGKITATFGPVEIRDFGGTGEAVLTYPHPDLRLKNGTEGDHLASVRSMTNAAGARAAGQVYVPFGEQVQIGAPLSPEETKGFIGERFDSDVGLQYLNARYYDPKLGKFLQPDWFEVTQQGMGTNRYAYSGNDPVNRMDPGGNQSTADDAKKDANKAWSLLDMFGLGTLAKAKAEALASRIECVSPGAPGSPEAMNRAFSDSAQQSANDAIQLQ